MHTGSTERSAHGGLEANRSRRLIAVAGASLLVWGLLNCEAAAAHDVFTLKIEIEKGVPSVRSFPQAAAVKVGWRYLCSLEATNKDAAARTLSLRADGRDLLTALHDPIAVSPGRHASGAFLLQTLNPSEHVLNLTAWCGSASATARINVVPGLEWGAASFGALDHFNVEGPIAPLAQPPAGEAGKFKTKAGKGWKGSPEHMARLAAAPGPELGARILADMRLLQDLGCQVYRTDVSWSIVEAVQGTFRWDRNDWLLDALRSPQGGGCRVIAQIGYQPAWLSPFFPLSETGLEAYQRWVEAAVSRYAAEVDFWEVCNEPMVFWLPPPKNFKTLTPAEADEQAEKYADAIFTVIRTASKIIRAQDPSAVVLSPGFENFFQDKHPFRFKVYENLLRRGMAGEVDAFCIHSYPRVEAPRSLSDPKPWRLLDRKADSSNLIHSLRGHGVQLPLYCTEFGVFRLPGGAGVKEETLNALEILRGAAILAHQGFRGVLFYELYDYQRGKTIHLARHTDKYKTRGFIAFRKLIEALAGAAPCEPPQIPQARILDADYDGLVIKAFRRGQEDILCIWSNDAQPRGLRLEPRSSASPAIWQQVKFSPAGEFLTGNVRAEAGPLDVTVSPLEFHILSRIGDEPGFGWLDRAAVQ
jgi:hypothetical protein